MSNLTIDDASPDIVYSDNWSLQLSDDPNTSSFFQSTYHSAQADGATANITFTGSSIYLYGSKGPFHQTNYSVQFDDFIIFLSANAPETAYQQNLFNFTFSAPGQHFLSLTSHFNGDSQWLDLDYVIVTVDQGLNSSSPSPVLTPAPGVSPTIAPPWLASPSSTSDPVSPSSSGAPQSGSIAPMTTSASSTSKTTLVLSILFGSTIALAIVTAFILCILRRRHAQRLARERTFRYGGPGTSQTALASPISRAPPPPPLPLPPQMREVVPAYISADRGSSFTALSAAASSLLGLGRPDTPQSTSTDARLLVPSRPPPPFPPPPPPTPASPLRSPGLPPPRPKRPGENILGWVSGSIGWDVDQRPHHTGDANSLRTDFLQV